MCDVTTAAAGVDHAPRTNISFSPLISLSLSHSLLYLPRSTLLCRFYTRTFFFLSLPRKKELLAVVYTSINTSAAYSGGGGIDPPKQERNGVVARFKDLRCSLLFSTSDRGCCKLDFDRFSSPAGGMRLRLCRARSKSLVEFIRLPAKFIQKQREKHARP